LPPAIDAVFAITLIAAAFSLPIAIAASAACRLIRRAIAAAVSLRRRFSMRFRRAGASHAPAAAVSPRCRFADFAVFDYAAAD
jgi:hypothetical protein